MIQWLTTSQQQGRFDLIGALSHTVRRLAVSLQFRLCDSCLTEFTISLIFHLFSHFRRHRRHRHAAACLTLVIAACSYIYCCYCGLPSSIGLTRNRKLLSIYVPVSCFLKAVSVCTQLISRYITP